MIDDPSPTIDDLDVVLCPPALRGDAARALAINMRLVAQTMDDCQRRALELGLRVHADRVAMARGKWVEAIELLGKDPR